MFHYVAIRNADANGVYKCLKDDDYEGWHIEGKDVFPDFEAAVTFKSEKGLKIGQEVAVAGIELFKHDSRTTISLGSQFINVREVEPWLIKNIQEVTQTTPKLKISERKDDRYWTADFYIGKKKEWHAIVTYIVGRVEHDPRDIPGRVHFEMDGIKCVMDVDLVKSGFDDLYESHISPTLEEMARAKGENLTDDDEIKRQVLPLMTKILVQTGPIGGFHPPFLQTHNKIIIEVLNGNFELFIL